MLYNSLWGKSRYNFILKIMRLSVGREKQRKGGDRMNEITLTDLYGIVVGIQKDMIKMMQMMIESKDELADTKAELKQDIADVRQELADTKAELKQDIKDMENKICSEVGDFIRTDVIAPFEQRLVRLERRY